MGARSRAAHQKAARREKNGNACAIQPQLENNTDHHLMLKGTRSAIVKRVQPVSVHGQVSLDVFWVDPEDPEEEIRHARVGYESAPRDMDAGDQVTLHYLLGEVTHITK